MFLIEEPCQLSPPHYIKGLELICKTLQTLPYMLSITGLPAANK